MLNNFEIIHKHIYTYSYKFNYTNLILLKGSKPNQIDNVNQFLC